MRSGAGTRSRRSKPPPASTKSEPHAGPRPSLPARLQTRLERLYAVETPAIDPFVRASEHGRELVELVEDEGELSIAVHLPSEAVSAEGSLPLDLLCQVVEGVSHFVYLAERARRGLPATQLELELQAEVDKFVIVAEAIGRAASDEAERRRLRALRAAMFERVRYLHEAHTEPGARYRLANELAARFIGSIEDAWVGARDALLLARLRRFHGAGQREKIEMARAA